jgi:hypothetical protein
LSRVLLDLTIFSVDCGFFCAELLLITLQGLACQYGFVIKKSFLAIMPKNQTNQRKRQVGEIYL